MQAQSELSFAIAQLFDQNTFTYTYILGCPVTREAVIIDPVLEKVFRDLAIISQLDLKLKYAGGIFKKILISTIFKIKNFNSILK